MKHEQAKVQHICPICHQECDLKDIHTNGRPGVNNFLCYAPLANEPLHYYSYSVVVPQNIATTEEFSLDLGNKAVIFAIDFQKKTTAIKSKYLTLPLSFDFIIVPDFPNLISLKKKVRTLITFG
jgi:hypothetical protein